MEWINLLSDGRLGGPIEESYNDRKQPRSEFEKDYRRIVTSASFRRLQDKTQVFPLDRSDFVRTRLTHSIETASFAKELGDAAVKIIRENNTDLETNIDDIPDILVCAGLLHDIGNPPFGHFGEIVIGDWFDNNLEKHYFCGQNLKDLLIPQMKNDLYHFEGNAQALRVLTKLHLLDNDKGYNLTTAILNTLIKYPNISTNINSNHNDIKYRKMGYFYADRKAFADITQSTGTFDKDNGVVYRHPLTYILEIADDIAYTTADLEDGFKKGLFTLNEFQKFLTEQFEKYENHYSPTISGKVKQLFDKLQELREFNPTEKGINKEITNKDLYDIQNWVVYVQGWLTHAAKFGFKTNYDEIMKGTYEKDLLHGTNHELSLKILKEAMKEFIFPAKSIVKLELAAETILTSLLDKFIPAVIYYDYEASEQESYKQSKAEKKLTGLLPENYIENYKLEANNTKDEVEKLYLRLLLITDFISGMTDSYAKTLYQKLQGIY